MTIIDLQLQLPEDTYRALQKAAAQAHKTEAEIALDAIQAYLSQLSRIDPLLGLFAHDPELIDQVEADAMRSREGAVLRVTEVNGG